MPDQPTLTLNDGNTIPQLGLGTYKLDDAGAERISTAAIAAGYRHIDTAAIYGNEAGVGAAVRGTDEWIYVTSKLWVDSLSRDAVLKAFDASMAKLGIAAMDLYLIHWPAPGQGKAVETWQALVELRDSRRVTSIGVSNFRSEDLERIIGETGVVPAVNQIELHPGFQQRALRDFHAEHGIVTESWSPLGQGKELDAPELKRIADKHRRTPAQVVLRWHLDSGLVAIPKTASPERLPENLAVSDFKLDAEDMAAIAGLDRADGRIGPDPAAFNGFG